MDCAAISSGNSLSRSRLGRITVRRQHPQTSHLLSSPISYGLNTRLQRPRLAVSAPSSAINPDYWWGNYTVVNCTVTSRMRLNLLQRVRSWLFGEDTEVHAVRPDGGQVGSESSTGGV